MTVDVEYEKRSVTLPKTLVEDVKERVGKREFSAYVARAIKRQLQSDALDEAIAEMEAKHGPVDEAEVEAIMARLNS